MNQNIIEKFNDLLGEEKVKVDEPMKRHTTFRIGGPADYFLLPSSEEELSGILKICKNEELPYFILGNGSNLLVSDEGYRGVIIQLYRNYGDITVKGNEIHATAGALLSQIAAAAKNASLTGFEFAGGIPGTLGGAVVMNAGAYGGEMKDVLKEVTVMTAAGEILVLPAEKLEMGYRTSLVKTKGYLVLSAVIVLEQGNQEAIKARMKELTEQRVSKQPLEFPSAGSTFKRPEGYFAGKLMCCLKNEEETYEVLNSKLPGIGDTVTTADGLRGEVHSVNVLRQTVKVIVVVDKDEKEIREYKVDQLKFKPRRKKGKGGEKQDEAELKKLEALEKREGKSRLNDK